MSSSYRMMCKFFDLLICIFQCISLFSANKVEKSFPIILKIQILSVLIIPRSAWYSYFITRICLVPKFFYPDLPGTWVFDTRICLVHDPLLHMSFKTNYKKINYIILLSDSHLPEI